MKRDCLPKKAESKKRKSQAHDTDGTTDVRNHMQSKLVFGRELQQLRLKWFYSVMQILAIGILKFVYWTDFCLFHSM